MVSRLLPVVLFGLSGPRVLSVLSLPVAALNNASEGRASKGQDCKRGCLDHPERTIEVLFREELNEGRRKSANDLCRILEMDENKTVQRG